MYSGIASLRINDANLDDSGTYRIKVENPIGKDEAEARLLVGHTAVLDETPNIHPEDAGIYTCIAENNLGQDQTSSEASITKTPNVDANPIMNPDSFRNLNKPLDFPVDILPVEEYFFPPKIQLIKPNRGRIIQSITKC